MKAEIQTVELNLISAVITDDKTQYVFTTESCKGNPFNAKGKKAEFWASIKQAEIIAKNAGIDLSQLTLIVGKQDSVLTVDTFGTHAIGDKVIDSKTMDYILVPVEDRESYTADSLDAEGYRIYTKAGANYNKLSVALLLSEKTTDKLLLNAARIAAEIAVENAPSRPSRRKSAVVNTDEPVVEPVVEPIIESAILDELLPQEQDEE